MLKSSSFIGDELDHSAGNARASRCTSHARLSAVGVEMDNDRAAIGIKNRKWTRRECNPAGNVRQETIPGGTDDQIGNVAGVIRMVRINGKIASSRPEVEMAASSCEAGRLTKTDFVDMHSMCSGRQSANRPVDGREDQNARFRKVYEMFCRCSRRRCWTTRSEERRVGKACNESLAACS